jgi:protein-L-isoaspartate(D-aspartate) O-methyltransferase
MSEARDTAQKAMVQLIRRRGVKDEGVLRAMEVVPRDAFVGESVAGRAFGDFALPIGCQQTISQPYIVALMTEALALQPGDRVLEIGTGSGYQAAVLAEMGMDVYTVERIPELYQAAKERLAALGYRVHHRRSDGYEGWPDFAPYDGIIVTAAATKVPDPLVSQLAEGGRLVIPVGQPGTYQILWTVIRREGQLEKVNMGSVAFVPFISEAL